MNLLNLLKKYYRYQKWAVIQMVFNWYLLLYNPLLMTNGKTAN